MEDDEQRRLDAHGWQGGQSPLEVIKFLWDFFGGRDSWSVTVGSNTTEREATNDQAQT